MTRKLNTKTARKPMVSDLLLQGLVWDIRADAGLTCVYSLEMWLTRFPSPLSCGRCYQPLARCGGGASLRSFFLKSGWQDVSRIHLYLSSITVHQGLSCSRSHDAQEPVGCVPSLCLLKGSEVSRNKQGISPWEWSNQR